MYFRIIQSLVHQFYYLTIIQSIIRQIVKMLTASKTSKGRTMDNIEFVIYIGEHQLIICVPKQTTVSGLMVVVRSYQEIHQEYGPLHSHFIGLASMSKNPIIDYLLTQPTANFLKFKKKLQLRALYSPQRKIDKLSANQFEYLKCLGKGACGQVYLVRSRITGYLFAMKRMKKNSIQGFRSVQSLIRQKNILSSLGSNMHTVTFHASFQSSSHVNFLMDYYPGGQLFLHLSSNRKEKLNEDEVKIYFCQILAAMEFLHRHKILYRDLKPENILVDINGHLRIADFGLSKSNFTEDDNAFSVCGSPQYMAPEILQNKTYNFSADFYSIGALLYELLAGLPPYYNQAVDDEEQKLELMKNMELNLDAITTDIHIKQLLFNLLNADPQMRICNFQEIKNSPWLTNVDWRSIQIKNTKMPFAPQIYSSYIGDQFLDLQNEVDELNYVDDQNFEHQLDQIINYVKPQSRKLFGLAEISLKQKEHCISKELRNNDHHLRDKESKRKTTGFTKEKDSKKLKAKASISIALYERQESINELMPTEPRTVKHKEENKENVLRREPSRKILSKQPSNGNLLKNQHVPSIASQMSNISSQINLFKSQQTHRQGLISNPSQTNSECSSKKLSKAKDIKEIIKTRISDIADTGRSKGKSKQKSMRDKSAPKNMMKKKEEKKNLLPTTSYKIKLT